MRNKTIHYLILLLLLIATNVKTQSLFANERQDFQFIDLGLSVDWAICNLGAVTPEGFGNYFAFGELLPKQQFTKDNYKHSKIVLGDIQGNPLYDVGASSDIFLCRIPTSEEWEELINNCVWSETIENGIKGQRITGPNGNSIFIPLSGWYDSRPQINDVGNYGRYWTSESADDMANFVYIGSWERGISENPRYMGYSIRIVRGKVNSKHYHGCKLPNDPPNDPPCIIEIPIDSVMPKKKKEWPDSCPQHPDLPIEIEIPIDSVMPKKKKEWPDSCPQHPDLPIEIEIPKVKKVKKELPDSCHHPDLTIEIEIPKGIWENNDKPKKSDIHICPDENHPHAIDLGLPSGTKWSCCNIGAKHPEEPGDCFAWGEIETKDVFSNKNYSLKGKNIGNEISETQYDAAYINWGNEWCTPTVKQLQELLEYCSTESIDCASGVIFTGPNGKKLFLPYFNVNTEDFGIGIYMSGSLSDNIDYLGPVNIEYTRSLFLFDLPNESYEMSREERMQLSLLKAFTEVWDDTYGQKIIDWIKIAKQIIKPVKSNNN